MISPVDFQLPDVGPRLVVMDVDSTFISQEVIEELADRAGKRAEVAEITAAAMLGELDFAGSLARRVATLEGLPETIFDEVRSKLTFNPGVPEFVTALHQAGWPVGLVSGGFSEVVAPLAASLGIEMTRANSLAVVDGKLTGRTQGPVITRRAKAETLTTWAAQLGLPVDQAVAIGDGANDIDMVQLAGIGVAFNAKPALREVADVVVDGPMDQLLAPFGLQPTSQPRRTESPHPTAKADLDERS